MRRNDYIQLLSAGLLKASQGNFDRLLDFIKSRFEVNTPRKPKMVSIGGRDLNGKELGLEDWITGFRNDSVKNVRFFYASFSNNIEPHIAAAFAGTQDSILQITTDKGESYFALQTFFSPAYAITPQQFTELVDAQLNATGQWQSIEEQIQKSNKLNNWPLIKEGSVKSFLNSKEGTSTFDRQVSDFVQEMQLNAIVEEKDFIIPASLQALFYKSDFSFGSPAGETAYLYPQEEVNAEDLLALINAQPFADEIWTKVENYYKTYPSEDIPPSTAKEWSAALRRMDGDLVNGISFTICRQICEVCEEKKLQPIIPPALSNLFGPDELELKRIRARSSMSDTQWYLNSNTEGWEFYFFERLDYNGTIEKKPAEEELKCRYKNVLSEIEKFASKIQSSYAETFRLALYLISTNSNNSHFDEKHLATIVEDLKGNNFSEYAIGNFSNLFYYSEELTLMNWTREDIYAFWSLSISDVFGGMGSWNDQYVESESDYALYQKLSADLFNSLKEYYLSLLSK